MIERTYIDAFGNDHEVPSTTIDTLEEAMRGRPDDPSPLVVRAGDTPVVGPGTLTLEDGSTLDVEHRLPSDLPLGYHRLEGESGRDLIVSPGRCHLPARRTWGFAAQLYATRSADSWGMGDLADLGTLNQRAASLGAGLVLVNPLLAVPPITPQHTSPYYPASRRFLNPLYLRVEDVPGARGEDLERAAAAGKALNRGRTIDRDEVWRLKARVLEQAWESRRPDPAFADWKDRQGRPLEEFACWCVLTERHGPDFTAWPDPYRRPGPALERVREEDPGRLDYHCWLQWLTRVQLEKASQPAMLMQDLPIGVDPRGADAWIWQDQLALEVSVGAPPDEFNTQGQDWGLPPFIPHRLRAAGYRPFIETIRSNLLSGGGLRIDHVMGLFRLFCIPEGASPAEGAYVRMPSRELLDIVALESARAEAVVVGEDLGTVEPGVREELADRRMLSYRLLWFEEDDPRQWPPLSMASVTTHDLPTVAGLWTGSDLAEQHAAGLEPNVESTEAMRARVGRIAGVDDSIDMEKVIEQVHRRLATAPSRLMAATLDDVAEVSDRPNMPGADHERDNWSLALPVELDELLHSRLAERLASIFNGAMEGGNR